MAVNYGLLTGLIYLVITSAANLTVANMIMFYVVKLIGYILYFVIIGIFAARIRKANGGYIEFKEIFGAVFIMILIVATISYAYSFLYMFVIDPHFMEKIKAASLNFMENVKAPEAKIDETAKKFDTQMEESKHFSFKTNVLTLFGAYLLDSLFGLIVCAIVKRSRPHAML
jgi:hypothetical protein